MISFPAGDGAAGDQRYNHTGKRHPLFRLLLTGVAPALPAIIIILSPSGYPC